MAANDNKILFTPTNCGALTLKNRIVYPAMTRARAPGRKVNSEMVKYYAARVRRRAQHRPAAPPAHSPAYSASPVEQASAGMIVTEPSAISEAANGYNDSPGMYTEEHAAAWAEVTKALHAKKCTVVAQLWHTGRMSHSSFQGGEQIVSASELAIVPRHGSPACGVQGADGAWYAHETPRALTTAEVEEVVEAFGKAAKLAKVAGFDGVEVCSPRSPPPPSPPPPPPQHHQHLHPQPPPPPSPPPRPRLSPPPPCPSPLQVHAGSGYLLDTFLQSCSNIRDDKYGGDAAGRCTLLKEVVARVAAEMGGADRVGVKLSPNNGFNGMGSDDNAETFMHLAAELYKLNIAYLHVTDGIGDSNNAASKKASWYVPTHAITPPSLSRCHSLTAAAAVLLLQVWPRRL